MSANAVSVCAACGAQIPVGFQLCKDCERLNFNVDKVRGQRIIVDGLKRRWRRKRVKAGLVNTSQYFPMMFKANAKTGKGFTSYYRGRDGIHGGNRKRGQYKNLARTARFAHYGRGSRKIPEFFKK